MNIKQVKEIIEDEIQQSLFKDTRVVLLRILKRIDNNDANELSELSALIEKYHQDELNHHKKVMQEGEKNRLRVFFGADNESAK
jgi:MFS superfamily sulfate permease-like transporter